MFTDVVIFITLAHWFVYFYFLFPYFFIYFFASWKKIEWIWKRDDTSASDLENGDQLNSSGAHSWRALKASHELEKKLFENKLRLHSNEDEAAFSRSSRNLFWALQQMTEMKNTSSNVQNYFYRLYQS